MHHRSSLDLNVPIRQSFGGMFERTSRDEELTRDILTGTLKLSPHPEWALPSVLTWKEDPFVQRNWRAQLHMLRWLEPLRRSALNGNQEARTAWINHVRSWVVSNRPDKSGSAGDFAWSDMVDGIRGLCMVFGLPLVEDDQDWLLEAVWEHGEWLADPAHLGRANHALHQHQSLLVIGALFRHNEWQQTASSRMMDLFNECYDAEGINNEGSLGYHKNNYVWWRTALRRLEVENIPISQATSRLNLALTGLAHATRPNGRLELIGDTEETTLGSLSSPEIDYVKSSGASGKPPTERTKVYERGYIFGRSGWGEYERDFASELFYSISFGFANRVHGHQDGGSITLHSNGHPWLIDAGKYAYKNDPMRTYCLSRMGHNVVVLKNIPYDSSCKVILESHTLNDNVDEFVFRDTGYEGVEIVRHVLYSRAGDFMIIDDTIHSTRGDVEAAQRWHIDADTQVETSPTGFELVRRFSKMSLTWVDQQVPAFSVFNGLDDPLDGWMSTKWMEKKPAPVLQAQKRGQTIRFTTVVSPAEEKKSFDINEVIYSGDQLRISAAAGRNHVKLSMRRDGSNIAVQSHGSTEWDSPISLVRDRLKALFSGGSADLAPMPPVDEFNRGSWQKLLKWIGDQPQPMEARMRVLDGLLELLSKESAGGPTDDQGLRAAIIDLAGDDISREIGLSDSSVGVMREPLIRWPGTSLMSRTYKVPIAGATTPRNIPDPEHSPSITTAIVHGMSLPFVTRRGTSDVLTVRFHGALNRTRSTLPMFQGLSVANKADDSYMIFSDPTLDLNRSMSLAWFLGTKEADLHRICASYILEAQKRLNASSVLLTGSSGGGFAALQIAPHVPGAKVLVFNPQTDVRSYFSSAAETAISSSFGESLDALNSELSARTSAVKNYQSLLNLPEIIYVQNSGDIHHVEDHRVPFEDMLKKSHPHQMNRVTFIDEHWGPGHIAPNAEKYLEFYRKAVSPNGDVSSLAAR